MNLNMNLNMNSLDSVPFTILSHPNRVRREGTIEEKLF